MSGRGRPRWPRIGLRRHGLRGTAANVLAVLLFSAAEIGVRTVALQRLARWAGAPLQLDAGPAAPAGWPAGLSRDERDLLDALDRVARRWPLGSQGACLRHALAAGVTLRRLHPRLRLSVDLIRGNVTAHAWVEAGGLAVTDPGDLFPLPAPLSTRGRRPTSGKPPRP